VSNDLDDFGALKVATSGPGKVYDLDVYIY